MNITLLHDDAGQRYNLYVDGQYAAYAEAWRSGRVADMSHTDSGNRAMISRASPCPFQPQSERMTWASGRLR